VLNIKNPVMNFNYCKNGSNTPISKLTTNHEKISNNRNIEIHNQYQEGLNKISQEIFNGDPPSTPKNLEETSSQSLLTGNYWDQGNDTDGDGKFNQLIIVTEINITVEQIYNLTIDLNSVLGYYSWQMFSAEYCSIGIQNMSIPFNVAEIYSEELVTSYQIVKTQITANFIILEEDYSNYTTQIYPYTAFDPPRVYQKDLVFHSTQDTNGNGYIDEFYFAASFAITVEGYYLFNVAYHTTEDNYSSWLFTGGWYGIHNSLNIEFYFDPTQLYSREINTSYTFDSIFIEDKDQNYIGNVQINYITPVFNFNDFEPPEVHPTGRYWDHGIDTNSNGKIDSLAVIIELDVTLPRVAVQTGYHIVVDLSFGTIRRSTRNTVQYYQDGLVNTTLEFDTSTFYNYFTYSEKISDRFTITWIRITDSFSEIVYESQMSFITSEYFFYDFDSPLIAIEDNSNFIYFANLEGWEGSGTIENPYIIEGLSLNGTTFSFPIIEIRNTQIHFIIQECILFGSEIGIRLVNVENAVLRNNTFLDTDMGIESRYCTNIYISGNNFNTDEATGVKAEQVQHLSILGNDMKNTERAIIIQHARDVSISNNVILSSDGWTGIDLEEVNHSNITNNRISGFHFTGILLEVCTYIEISKNIIFRNGDAIRIGGSLPYLPFSSRFNNISTNLICENNAYGVYMGDLSTLNLIKFNILSNDYTNGSYLAFDSGTNNTFFQNYWNELVESSIDGGNNNDLFPLLKANHLSSPRIIQPNGGEKYSSTVIVQWVGAKDVFNQNLNYSVFYSSDNGTTWHFLSSDYGSSTTSGEIRYKYDWKVNRSEILLGSSYLIRVKVSDPFGFSNVVTSNSTFTIGKQEDVFMNSSFFG
ncbi:MAG: right-handed parallel beta-helix repeat-containing protein, partial [Candidatus Hodarchaeales archaeon]